MGVISDITYLELAKQDNMEDFTGHMDLSGPTMSYVGHSSHPSGRRLVQVKAKKKIFTLTTAPYSFLMVLRPLLECDTDQEKLTRSEILNKTVLRKR
ncbi:hypothetical protein CHS0354_013695, partial [Potamilus streckersoni]